MIIYIATTRSEAANIFSTIIWLNLRSPRDFKGHKKCRESQGLKRQTFTGRGRKIYCGTIWK